MPSSATTANAATASASSAPAMAAVTPSATAATSVATGWQTRAAKYLDGHSEAWLSKPPNTGSNFPCAVSCHTTHAFSLARQHLGEGSPVDKRMLAAVIERVKSVDDWRKATPMYGRPGSDKERESRGTEAVLHASTLAFSPASTAGRQALVDKAFQHLWASQRADGSWEWLNFDLQPLEADNEDWGAALAALATGRARKTAQGAKLKGYLRSRLASGKMRLHAQGMLLWATSEWSDLLEAPARQRIADALVAKQHGDGGWSTGELGFDKSPTPHPERTDGYATAVSTLALCSFKPSTTVEKGLAYLKSQQRPNGSWSGYSLNGDSPRAHGYMSDAATAYATLALTQCR